MDFRDRIVADADILTGKPRIKGTRISVELVMDMLSQGASFEDVLEGYPFLTRQDIQACIAYATAMMKWKDVSLNAA